MAAARCATSVQDNEGEDRPEESRMTPTCTPPGPLPAQPPDASADPPTVPLPVQPGAVVVQQVPMPTRRGGRVGALALAAAVLVAAGVGAVLLCAPEYAKDPRTLSCPLLRPRSSR
jgi:hypothetical protein